MSSRWVHINLFEKKLNLDMKDKSLLNDALTHPSFQKSRFEALEFIGDRVVGLAASEFLWRNQNQKESNSSKAFDKVIAVRDSKNHFDKSINNKNIDEKEYARSLVSLTNKNAILKLAKSIDLGAYVRWKGINSHEETILSDAFEALMGAIFLDLGFEVALEFLCDKWSKSSTKTEFYELDPKSMLQIWANKNHFQFEYSLLKEEGMPHDKSYTVQLLVINYPRIYGIGKSIKLAEKAAAKKFIQEFIK